MAVSQAPPARKGGGGGGRGRRHPDRTVRVLRPDPLHVSRPYLSGSARRAARRSTGCGSAPRWDSCSGQAVRGAAELRQLLTARPRGQLLLGEHGATGSSRCQRAAAARAPLWWPGAEQEVPRPHVLRAVFFAPYVWASRSSACCGASARPNTGLLNTARLVGLPDDIAWTTRCRGPGWRWSRHRVVDARLQHVIYLAGLQEIPATCTRPPTSTAPTPCRSSAS